MRTRSSTILFSVVTVRHACMDLIIVGEFFFSVSVLFGCKDKMGRDKTITQIKLFGLE